MAIKSGFSFRSVWLFVLVVGYQIAFSLDLYYRDACSQYINDHLPSNATLIGVKTRDGSISCTHGRFSPYVTIYFTYDHLHGDPCQYISQLDSETEVHPPTAELCKNPYDNSRCFEYPSSGRVAWAIVDEQDSVLSTGYGNCSDNTLDGIPYEPQNCKTVTTQVDGSPMTSSYYNGSWMGGSCEDNGYPERWYPTLTFPDPSTLPDPDPTVYPDPDPNKNPDSDPNKNPDPEIPEYDPTDTSGISQDYRPQLNQIVKGQESTLGFLQKITSILGFFSENLASIEMKMSKAISAIQNINPWSDLDNLDTTPVDGFPDTTTGDTYSLDSLSSDSIPDSLLFVGADRLNELRDSVHSEKTAAYDSISSFIDSSAKEQAEELHAVLADNLDFSFDYTGEGCNPNWFVFDLPARFGGSVPIDICKYDPRKYTRPLFMFIAVWILVGAWRRVFGRILS